MANNNLSNQAPFHHQTTTGTSGDEQEYKNLQPTTHSSSAHQTTNLQSDVDTAAPRERLSSVHEPRTSLTSGSTVTEPLASTEGPFHQPTTSNTEKKNAPLTSSVSSQNAPGSAGKIGEAVMSGFGYGGTHVERPKEEQGLGEKIVNFLGA